MGDLSRHFSRTELSCRCGCGLDPDPELVKVLEQIREVYGKPMGITSGARCPARNAKVGGVPNSAHTRGCAADIAATPEDAYRIAMLAMAAGVNRIGVSAKGFIHIDIDHTLPAPRLWQYGK